MQQHCRYSHRAHRTIPIARERREKVNDEVNDQAYRGSDEAADEAVYADEVVEEQQTQLVYSNAYDGYLNIRQRPTVKSSIIGQLRNGPKGAEFIGAEGNWIKVRYNGVEGYVSGSYVQYTPTVAVDPDISVEWLQGVWLNPVGAYGEYYFIFNNGTYARSHVYGDISYGTYKLEGRSIVFTHKYSVPNVMFSYESIQPVERYQIDLRSVKVGNMTRYEFYTEQELREALEDGCCEDAYYTRKHYDERKKIVKSKLDRLK